MDLNIFSIKDNEISLNTYKITVRKYATIEKEQYTDSVYYVNPEGLYEYEVNYIPKHQLYELVSKEELDTSEYAWMEGIQLKTENTTKEIEQIASYGSIEAYQASLPESTDNMLLDMMCSIAELKLGINEEV